MNERYLHHLWKNKLLPFHKLKTIDNKEIQFVNPGFHNENESGPDFTMAKLKIDDLMWIGSVEIHVLSSDWYKHKHHIDKAYENVILHVVYEHDKSVEITNRLIPTIELKSFIDLNHFNRFLNFYKSPKFPCKFNFYEYSKTELPKMIELAVEGRLLRKIAEFSSRLNSDSHRLYLLTAHSFGSSVNKQPFEQFANNYSLERIYALLKNNNIDKLTNQLWGEVKNYNWKTKGLHAASIPFKRFEQFIKFITNADLNFPFWSLPASLIILHFQNEFYKVEITSKIIIDGFLINVLSPIIYHKGIEENRLDLKIKAIQILKNTNPESNRFTKIWEELGVKPQNAYDSQGLLEIYQQLCTRKDCLNCLIGKNVLKL